MALTLRTAVGRNSPLTNAELDQNFIYLEEMGLTTSSLLDTTVNTTIPALETEIQNALDLKQALNAKLTSISSAGTGIVAIASSTSVVPRTITGSTHITVTNGTGVSGNPTISVGAAVLTSTSTHTVSNKTFSGNNNTFSNLSLTSAVSGILPLANGGTNAATATDARASLNVLVKPSGTGFVSKTATDGSVSRTIVSSGSGISITDGNGVNGNPTIVSNATTAATANTIALRDADGSITANKIFASIPNTSLVNNGVTVINGVNVPLGGSVTIPPDFLPIRTANIASTIVARDANGAFSAGEITATSLRGPVTGNVTGNVAGNVVGNLTGNVTGNVTGSASLNLLRTGGTLTGSLTLHANPTANMHAATKQYVDTKAGSTVFTCGASYTYNYTNQVGSFNYSYNYFDVFPPVGKTMSNLAAFIPSIHVIHFNGNVNYDDSFMNTYEYLSDRVRVRVQNTEQRSTPAANWLAIWN